MPPQAQRKRPDRRRTVRSRRTAGLGSINGIQGFINAFLGTLLLYVYGPGTTHVRPRHILDTGLPLAPPEYKEPMMLYRSADGIYMPSGTNHVGFTCASV